VRALGVEPAAARALGRVARAGLAGFWLHIDVDVVDSAVISAVDSPQAGGLTLPELADLLRLAAGHPACAGVELTIFDPDLDPDGSQARALAEATVAGLRAR
jgi:arginase